MAFLISTRYRETSCWIRKELTHLGTDEARWRQIERKPNYVVTQTAKQAVKRRADITTSSFFYSRRTWTLNGDSIILSEILPCSSSTILGASFSVENFRSSLSIPSRVSWSPHIYIHIFLFLFSVGNCRTARRTIRRGFVSIVFVFVVERLVNHSLTACIGMIYWDDLVMTSIGIAMLKSDNYSSMVLCHLCLGSSIGLQCSRHVVQDRLALGKGYNRQRMGGRQSHNACVW